MVYGKHLTHPIHISVPKLQIVRAYHEAGMSTPFEITGEGVDQLVLFHHLHVDSVTDHLIHAELLAVRKDEKVRVEVPLILVGESPFEKNGLGTVQLVKNAIRVIAFPLDLPHDIKVDISHIEYESHGVHVRDLQVSDKIQIDEDLDDTLVSATVYVEEVEEVPVVATDATAMTEGDAATAATKEEPTTDK